MTHPIIMASVFAGDTKVFEAMNMKIDQLLKAAKRYSAKHEIPLAQAQEDLATFFGFSNLHAARKALTPKTEESEDTSHKLILGSVGAGKTSLWNWMRPCVLVLHGPAGCGKSTFARTITEASGKRFAFVPEPSALGAAFDFKPDWDSFDGVVFDEPCLFDKASASKAISELEQECVQRGKTLLIIAQYKDDLLKQCGVSLVSDPGYCRMYRAETTLENYGFEREATNKWRI